MAPLGTEEEGVPSGAEEEGVPSGAEEGGVSQGGGRVLYTQVVGGSYIPQVV